MKKLLYAAPLLALALTFTACDPSQDDESAQQVVSSEELTQEFQLVPKSEGNNNFTVYTTPSRYIWVYDAATKQKVGEGTKVNIQVIPPTTDASFYIETRDMAGNSSVSSAKSAKVSEYTDLPEIYDKVFKAGGKGDFTTTYWTWNDKASDGVWGNGGYLEATGPGWWIVQADGIDEQAKDKKRPADGLNGWFGLNLSGVTTSRGETGSVRVTEDVVKAGWDVATMTFSGTTPLLGVQPNGAGFPSQYVYQILKADGEELRLCAPEPGAGDWGTAWFWNFKRIDR
ncbi:MAG: hypothetical protein K6A82_06440 [Prevotella sp.]|nr:hypothetical protein [Prevotella sp.]